MMIKGIFLGFPVPETKYFPRKWELKLPPVKAWQVSCIQFPLKPQRAKVCWLSSPTLAVKEVSKKNDQVTFCSSGIDAPIPSHICRTVWHQSGVGLQGIRIHRKCSRFQRVKWETNSHAQANYSENEGMLWASVRECKTANPIQQKQPKRADSQGRW